MRRRRSLPIPLILLTVGVIIFVIFLFSLFHTSLESEAEALVKSFYQYEQDADFSSSWELFHPQMKEKFDKSNYIQQRNHVFVGHFGTDTFTYTIGKAEELETWKMNKNALTLQGVYKVPITQTFKSTFGTFTIHQDIFVAHEKKKWTILWSYQ
ncbi:hypothetical protein [Fredinandcohnia quinoae]|uniref:SnoaL-like domain-containing protein n=1 Tax=Fredinandcohnia quinoae TaxID=2918902 RepID=A0AAW5E5N0_9BACI|nr:hypothetical protein [Fredinandcohnia sp. SECRCQ15]MCH1625192.1 hypothetical protein [Fredinandcohnia sp. SECRCQ15]